MGSNYREMLSRRVLIDSARAVFARHHGIEEQPDGSYAADTTQDLALVLAVGPAAERRQFGEASFSEGEEYQHENWSGDMSEHPDVVRYLAEEFVKQHLTEIADELGVRTSPLWRREDLNLPLPEQIQRMEERARHRLED